MMFSLGFSASLAVAGAMTANAGQTRAVFNDLTVFATRIPLARYPQEHFEKISDCMATAGPTLYPNASDAAWTGWIQFGLNKGQPGDPWSLNNTAGWMEYDPRNLTHEGHHVDIPIIEPCNTVSNLAYYRIIPDLCANRPKLTMDDEYVNAIIQSFATLGMGSSFMHGSRTSLGGAFDNIPISVISYQYFQLMNAPLHPGTNGSDSVLHELSSAPRAYDGRTLATKLHTIPLEFELNDWHAALNALDRPQYFFTFGAIIINALTLVAPDSVTDKLIPPLISLFGLSPEVRTFLLDTYVPTIRGAMAQLHPSLKEKASLLPKFAGTVMKLLYAFVFQEGIFKYSFLYNPEWNVFGALFMPSFNSLANKLTGFNHQDATIQKSDAIYPGQEWCRVKHTAPHAKWHEQSANGLMDLAYLSDAIRVVIDKSLARAAKETDVSTVFLTTDVFDAWALEMKAQPWSDGYLVTEAFVHVVMNRVKDMDKCVAGEVDGIITWEDLVCYLTGISSAAEFVEGLYKEVASYYKPALAQVHSTPTAQVTIV